MLHYEDFEIGETRRVASYVVSRDEIVEFAQRYDPQPFHIDEAAAKESIFGELTASSCHTFALVSLVHAKNPEPIALVANLGAEELRFPNPLRPDDEISLRSKTIRKRVSKSRPGIGILTTRVLLTNQREETLMEMTSNFMVRLRETS